MPVNLSIKEVPEALAERLRSRAARHHRSLQRELMAIIEQAVNEEVEPGLPAARGAIGGLGTRRRSIEEIAAAHRARFPRPITSGPLAVDIIRRDRDAR